MSDALKMEIKGLRETQRAMINIVKELHGSTMLNAMRTATLAVFTTAVRGVPVKTGRLKASITPEVRAAGTQVLGVVGSVVKYAAKVEQPGPVREHGRRPYLKPALTENQDKIFRLLDNAVGMIIRNNSTTGGGE
jgi:hypothetical protein